MGINVMERMALLRRRMDGNRVAFDLTASIVAQRITDGKCTDALREYLAWGGAQMVADIKAICELAGTDQDYNSIDRAILSADTGGRAVKNG